MYFGSIAATIILRGHPCDIAERTGKRRITAITHHDSDFHDTKVCIPKQFFSMANPDIPQIKPGGKAGLLLEPITLISNIIAFNPGQLINCDRQMITFADVTDGWSGTVFKQLAV